MATAEQDLPGYPFFLQEDPASTDQIYYSARDFRNYTAAFQRRSGVLGSSHFLVTQADNVGFKIKVHSGYVNVGGYYIAHLPNDIEIPLTGTGWKPGTGTVTHKVFAAVYDEYVAGQDNKATILVTQDTGSGAPNPSGAVAAYLQLATITVASTQANIQDQHISNTARHGGSASEFIDLSGYLASAYKNAGAPGGGSDFHAIYDSGVVRLGGLIKRMSGTTQIAFPNETDLLIGTIMSNLRPARTRYFTEACSISSNVATPGTYTYRLTIAQDGTMTARIPKPQTPMTIAFDGITYHLDY